MEIITSEAIHSNLDFSFFESLNPGQRILISLPSGISLANALIQAYVKGAVSIPISPRATAQQIAFYRPHSEANFFIDRNKNITQCSQNNHDKNDMRFIMYTSGTTGDPKGIILNKQAIEKNAQTLSAIHNFQDGHATCLPLFHCNAIMMSLIGSYLSQSKFFIQHKFDANQYFQKIKTHKIRTASIAPALLEELVESAPKWPDCLEYLITAAAPLTQNLASRFYRRYGPRIRQGYGLTEAVNFSFLMPQMNDNDFVNNYIKKHPPVGHILPGQEFKILDSGEIIIKGETLMQGYLKNEAKTREAFTNEGWLRTGDIGSIRDGFLVLKGRIKETINRGGETIYPIDIENHWEQIGLKKPFSAIPIFNEKLGEDIGLKIENNGLEALKIINNMKPYIPSVIYCAPLSTTSTGKPKRREMGGKLFSTTENHLKYLSLLATTIEYSEKILEKASSKIIDPASSASYIINEAKKLIELKPNLQPGIISHSLIEDIPAVMLQKIIVDNIDQIIQNTINGEDLVRRKKGLWSDLMCKWPMGAYATIASIFLQKQNLLEGRVLEVGAGIGNTSRLIKNLVNENYIRTDINLKILNKIDTPGKTAFYNFNEAGHWENIDTIFSVNAIHCAVDKKKTIAYLYEMLKDGGTLLLAEGNNVTDSNGTPWALNGLFGIFDGWWNVSGFQSREIWLELFEIAGFKQWGYSQLRSGEHDLGGLLWAKK